MTFKGRVVVQFNVLRNGTIRDLVVLQPAPIPALTNAAVNSLRLSNPTAALPPEYPADQVLFTVTFHYNEDPRSYP
jgi:TonB family protein